MKRVISMLILVATIVSCFSIPAVAAMPPVAEPLWDNVSLTTSTMVFDGTAGTAEMRVTGKSGVTKIEGHVVVYKLVGSNWVYVTEKSTSVTTISCYLKVTFTGETGYEYKADFTFTVYKNGAGEVITKTKTAVCE